MADCIFCKIIAGELPSTKVYEDDQCVAFLDINPTTKGHTLVVPKQHSQDLFDADPEVLGHVARVIPRIARAAMEGVGAHGFNFSVNNGAAAGQIIFHLHFHILPRFLDDGMKPWGHGTYADGEKEKIGEAIRMRL